MYGYESRVTSRSRQDSLADVTWQTLFFCHGGNIKIVIEAFKGSVAADVFTATALLKLMRVDSKLWLWNAPDCLVKTIHESMILLSTTREDADERSLVGLVNIDMGRGIERFDVGIRWWIPAPPVNQCSINLTKTVDRVVSRRTPSQSSVGTTYDCCDEGDHRCRELWVVISIQSGYKIFACLPADWILTIE